MKVWSLSDLAYLIFLWKGLFLGCVAPFFFFFFCKSVLKCGFFVPQHANEGVGFTQWTISPSQNVMLPLTHKRSLAGCLLHAVFEQVDSSNKKWDCFLFCDYGFVQYCCSYWRKINLGVNNNKVRSSRSIWNEFHILCKHFLLATPKQHHIQQAVNMLCAL